LIDLSVFLPPISKIEQCFESLGVGYDKHKDLYWFRPPERNILQPVEGSSEELITREITSLRVMQMCSFGVERASLCGLGCL
jgi:hypothetical protein